MLRPVGELLEFVEELPEDAVGEVVFHDESSQRGVVFVENNRICWAAARGLARRLVDLLRARADLDACPETLEQIFVKCKAQGTPFGEALLESGLVSPARLRDALRMHTAESIVAMMRTESSTFWNPRGRGGYNARYTFATGEIIAQVSAGLNPRLAASAEETLRKVVEDGDWGAAFLRSHHLAEPVPLASVGAIEVSSKVFLGIGKWAIDELDLAVALTRDPRASPSGRSPLVASMTSSRRYAVGWSDDVVVYVVQAAERGLGRLLHKRPA